MELNCPTLYVLIPQGYLKKNYVCGLYVNLNASVQIDMPSKEKMNYFIWVVWRFVFMQIAKSRKLSHTTSKVYNFQHPKGQLYIYNLQLRFAY
jgi:hypothetical protein